MRRHERKAYMIAGGEGRDKKVSAEIVTTPGGTRTKNANGGGRRMTRKEKGIRWEKGMGLGASGGWGIYR